MSVQTELDRLNAAKNSLKTVIESKGVAVPDSTKLDEYSALVEQISSGDNVQSDYAQNDPEQPDYIKNRPFYAQDVESTLVDQTFSDFTSYNDIPGTYASQSLGQLITLEIGKTYKVTWDGTEYVCIAQPISSSLPIAYIGDYGIIEGREGQTQSPSFPFFLADKAAMAPAFTTETETSHTVKIVGATTQYNKIDSNFLPEAKSGSNKIGAIEVIEFNSNFIPMVVLQAANEKLRTHGARCFWGTSESNKSEILNISISSNNDYAILTILNYFGKPGITIGKFPAGSLGISYTLVEDPQNEANSNIYCIDLGENGRIYRGNNGSAILPKYSSNNNNQFLQIVNGVPTWSSLPIYNGEVE